MIKPTIKIFLTRAAMTLLFTLMTSATAWAGQKPECCLEACTGGLGSIHIQGWAYDPDAPAKSLDLYFYIYTNADCTNMFAYSNNFQANVSRPDVNQAKGITGNHGFEADIPINSAGNYWVKLIAIDTNGDGDTQIGSTTKVTVTVPVTVTIGGDKYKSSSIPFVMDKNYSLSEQIYTAEEINMEGTITSIAFNYCCSMPFSMDGVQVYLKHTDKNNFNDGNMVPLSADDKVFEGTFSATGEGWVTIEFDTPFEYNGTSNLLVCCLDPTNGSFGDDYKFRKHQTSDHKWFYAESNDIVPSLDGSNLGNMYQYGKLNSRNQTRFNIYPGTFTRPDNITVSSCTEEEATLTWTTPETVHTITGYGYQFKKASDADWSDEVTTTDPSTTFSHLTADTDYDFRVRTIYESRKSLYQALTFTTATPLPYEQGFENDMGHWTMVDRVTSPEDRLYDALGTGRRTKAARNSNVGFQFSCYDGGNKIPQYLISPRFSGDAAITLSFYYRVPTNIAETIYVGYSTTTNDKDAFTFGDAITFKSSNWTKYEHTFPAEARYFAVKYASNEHIMYIDDFSFEESSTYAKPTTVGYTDLAETKATMVWNAPTGATGFTYQYKKASDAAWSAEATLNTNTVTLSGLTPNTYYNFRVKVLYGSNASNYAACTFQTDANVVDLSYSDGFENGMGGWRMLNCEGATKIVKPSNPHDGSYSFWFFYSDQNQYLLSPHFAGGTPIKVSFYYRNSENYSAAFHVGYTSSKDVAVTFEDVVTANSGNWELYETYCPPETQYVVICCRDVGADLYLDDFSFTGPIVLADDANNTTTISDAASLGGTDIIQLTGRTLYKDGDWNTICLPFDLNISGSPLDGSGVEARKLNSGSIEGSTLNLTFSDPVSKLEAGTPYIIKWTKANDYVDDDAHNIVNPVFSGVTIDKDEHIYDNQVSGDARVRFVGTYKNTTFNSEDKSILLLGANSTLYYPTTGAKLGACRAYFKIGEDVAGARGITSFDINYGDGTTSIVDNKREPITDGAFYTLDGRKLNGKPTAKGLYIVNGKKVIIK